MPSIGRNKCAESEYLATVQHAKTTKAEYEHYQMKLKNIRDKVEEAREKDSKDNDKVKAKEVAKIRKLVDNSIGMSESSADLHNQ